MIKSVAVLLFVCHYVSTYDIYSELKDLGVSCYPRDSCVPPRETEEDHLWGNYTCECGIHCLRYYTCCADSKYAGQSLNFQYRGETCEKPPGFQDAVVQVTRCSDKLQYYDRRIREKCENTVQQVEDPVAMAPVTSVETFVTYKNYFCALCNNDSEDVLLWSIKLELVTKATFPDLSNDEFLESLVYDAGKGGWGIVKNYAFHEVKVRYEIPPPLQKFVKKCYRHAVTDCSPDHAFNHELRNKCSSYYTPIKVKQVGGLAKMYRNVHCAMCNNAYSSGSGGSYGCSVDIHGRKKEGFSFALLLDVNTSDGDLVGKEQAVCGKQEKWDPFFKKCRYLSCALPGYVIKDGKCVPS